MNFAIVDIETTGGSPKSSKITEIAIYKHNGTKIIDEYSTLLNPDLPIPPFITQLTGISDQMVQNAPRFYEVAKQIVEFTQDCVFVAHNVSFDYNVIRAEFQSLGFDYRRPHLCTVRTSRHVIPGHNSYSLGKLTKDLGISISERHRAGGDAHATAQLFTLLYEKDPNNLSTFIQSELNPKKLHPNLDLQALEEIPNKVGIYRLYNDANQLIYIGKSIHIKKRIEQHLRNNKSKKAIQMQREIARIEFELTGSELIALLLESKLIKDFQPIYNRKLRRSFFPFGLYDYTDESGYIQLFITKTSSKNEIPLISFYTKKEAVAFLEKAVEEYSLCQKLCGLYPSRTSCFHYTIKACNGACIKEESPEEYNRRCQEFIDNLSLGNQSFFVVDQGRKKGEKSLIYIENGVITGMGHAPYHYNRQPPNRWKRYINTISNDRDARTILKLFLRKNRSHEIVYID